MSEYWKSTPKYWCKYCSTYVRDTKLERTNHEATAKHQSALKRFLRDLHRGHENEQREKDRAKREIDRLNGITTSKPSTSASSSSTTATVATAAQRQQQWEQLAEMGINVPTELRRDMALAGEWSVTSTRIIDDPNPDDDDNEGDSKPTNVDAVATGVHKRPKEESDDEKNEVEGVHNLFKKPRRWGRDTRDVAENDAELDALLGAPLTKAPKKEEEETEKPEIKGEPHLKIKREESETDKILPAAILPAGEAMSTGATIKEEPDKEPSEPVVVFKKRKPKNIRQK